MIAHKKRNCPTHLWKSAQLITQKAWEWTQAFDVAGRQWEFRLPRCGGAASLPCFLFCAFACTRAKAWLNGLPSNSLLDFDTITYQKRDGALPRPSFGRQWEFRTPDPLGVNEMLYRWANRPITNRLAKNYTQNEHYFSFSPLTASFKALPARNLGFFEALISISSPVRGFRPLAAARLAT